MVEKYNETELVVAQLAGRGTGNPGVVGSSPCKAQKYGSEAIK